MKFIEYITEAGATSERQEMAFIDAINSAVKKNGGKAIKVTGDSGKIKIPGIVKAEKQTGTNQLGKEPLTDVILTNKAGKSIRLSLKGSSAPSLAGGGKFGINELVPTLVKTAKNKIHAALRKAGKKTGDSSNDFYVKIAIADITKLIEGNEKVGGPIDYTYIGPMNLSANFDEKTSTLVFDGDIYDTAGMIAKYGGKFFLRFRKRRVDQKIDMEGHDKIGPIIFGKSPSKGDTGARIVISATAPKVANII